MNINTYQQLSGITVSTANAELIEGQIVKSQALLEELLGFSLDPDQRLVNHLTGVTPTYAFRYFDLRHEDVYLTIDPATAVQEIRIVRGTETVRTLEATDYRLHHKNGFIRHIERVGGFCDPNYLKALPVFSQLAVDADWMFETLPTDLLVVWAEMVADYTDLNRNIKSQTLGPHSYTKFERKDIADTHRSVLTKYAGANGSINKLPT